MARFTKALRQRIIEDFARQNNGWFDPHAFVAHVKSAGEEHPAYAWFQWDDATAADAYRLEQARDFARGLVVTFKVEEVKSGPVKISERSVPFATSPVASRKGGGGYYLTDPNDDEHMVELCRQAARDLTWFIRRYGAAVEHAGGKTMQLEKLLGQLENVQAVKAA